MQLKYALYIPAKGLQWGNVKQKPFRQIRHNQT